MVLTKYLVAVLELRERVCPSPQVTGITLIQSRVGGKRLELLKEAGAESAPHCGALRSGQAE